MATHQRRVRWYQGDLYKHIVSVEACRAIEIAHRRWGKDEIVLGATNERMHNRVGTYWHCLPEYGQARKAIWTAVNANTGKKRIDEAFPPETRLKTLNDDMFIELKNGSTWQLIGSDRYNATVGAGPVFIAYSEWALANPSAWAYHRPMLEENGGGAAFITTPRGKNHAHAMYLRYKHMMRDNPRYFAELSTIHDTVALSPAQLEESLSEYIDLYGEDVGRAQFEQEYECSFNAAIMGAFFGREMAKLRADSRIRTFEVNPDYPVHRAWDIGVRDDTSIWWFQVIGGRVYVIDCYTASGAGIDHYAEVVHAKPYSQKDAVDFVPHDAKVKEWGTGRTRVEVMREKKLNPVVVPMASFLDGIQAARTTLSTAVFHSRCEDIGISALEQYRREWDDEKKTFRATDVHDWTAHLAAAFRYLSLAWRSVTPKTPEKPKPSEPVYHVNEAGVLTANMSVREIIEAKIRRKAREDG